MGSTILGAHVEGNHGSDGINSNLIAYDEVIHNSDEDSFNFLEDQDREPQMFENSISHKKRRIEGAECTVIEKREVSCLKSKRCCPLINIA